MQIKRTDENFLMPENISVYVVFKMVLLLLDEHFGIFLLNHCSL